MHGLLKCHCMFTTSWVPSFAGWTQSYQVAENRELLGHTCRGQSLICVFNFYKKNVLLMNIILDLYHDLPGDVDLCSGEGPWSVPFSVTSTDSV